MKTMQVGKRNIIIGGIGKAYYQDGLPIEMTADILSDKGFEISWLHVADELFKNGWNITRVLNTLTPILVDSKYHSSYRLLHKFIHSDYEHQREIIFDYLFGNQETAKEWFRSTVKF